MCLGIRRRMDAGASEPSEILGHAAAVDVAVRRVESVDVEAAVIADVERRLDARREAIGLALGRRLTGREGVNFLRYRQGGFYLPHVDRAVDDEWPDAARRQVAVVVFLNDDFAGGVLYLIDGRRVVVPKTGQLVAFDAGLLHEVEPVTAGTRDTIVDWFY